MKKILYVIRRHDHKRVFESFQERNGLTQMIAGPEPALKNTDDGVAEQSYINFGIKNIKYFSNDDGLEKIIKFFGPDFVVYSDTKKYLTDDKKYKNIFVAHGIYGNNIISVSDELCGSSDLNNRFPRLNGFDLYCGGTNIFYKWIENSIGKNKNILLNAVPQLDLFCKSLYKDKKYRDVFLSNIKRKNPNKIILFVGSGAKDHSTYTEYNHNEDYFWTIQELERLSEKNNWLIIIKSKKSLNGEFRFLENKKYSWIENYIGLKEKIMKNKLIVGAQVESGHLAEYIFLSDCVVMNYTSTVEIEACAAGRPLVLVRTNVRTDDEYDPHFSSRAGVCGVLREKNSEKLERLIVETIENNNPKKQKSFVENFLKLSLDGLMYKRIQDRLAGGL